MVYSSLFPEDLLAQLRASVESYSRDNRISYLKDRLADSLIEADTNSLAQLCADSLIGMAFVNKKIPISTKDQETELFHSIRAVNTFLYAIVGKNYLTRNKDKFYILNTLLRKRPLSKESILDWYLNF